MLRYLPGFILIFWCSTLFGQAYDIGGDMQFVWEVKQINEFIERFNDSDLTLLKEYYSKHNSTKALTREVLIKSLFNRGKRDWNINELKSFIKLVDNKASPKYLDFFNDKWFAHVLCSVTYKGKPETATLTLKLEKSPNDTYKWVVCDTDAPFLKQVVALNKLPFRMPAAMDSLKSLNPMSHATDFMGIDQISDDRVNIADYFQDPEKCSAETKQFVVECLNTHLKIVRANSIVYNFMQIDGWDIEIQQFSRDDENSGWLISNLTKTSAN